MRHPFALLAAALLPFACSSNVATVLPGDGGVSVRDGASAGAAVTVDNFTAEYSAAACRSLFQCPGTDETATAQAFFENPTACVDRIRVFGAVQFDDLTASIRAGRARLDGAAARQCLDRLATSCQLSDLDASQFCPTAVVGTVAIGSGCWRNLECAPGSFCDHGPGSGARACPGTCRAQLAPGAACTSSRQCQVPSGHVAVCETGVCLDATVGAAAVDGAQCGSMPSGANAVTLIPCATGSYCAVVANNVGTCRRILTEGTPCVRDTDVCPTGLACVASVGTTTTTCRRVTVVNAAGGACDARGQTGFCNPLLGLRCNAAMTCERPGDGTLNARCQAGDLFLSCQAGLYCNSATMTCQAKLATGAECPTDAACASGECGTATPRRCLERICD